MFIYIHNIKYKSIIMYTTSILKNILNHNSKYLHDNNNLSYKTQNYISKKERKTEKYIFQVYIDKIFIQKHELDFLFLKGFHISIYGDISYYMGRIYFFI